MANEIKEKFGTATALTITVASLANASARQSDVVDNSTLRARAVLIYAKIKLGTSPTSNKGVFFYLIRDDGVTNFRTDNAGASDAAITIKNARQVGALATGSSAATGDTLYGSFLIEDPGPKWALAVYNDTGATLDATAGNHSIEYVSVLPEVQ